MKHTNSRLLFIFLLVLFLYPCTKGVAQDSKTFPSKGVVELGGNISYQYESMISRGSENSYYNILSFMPYLGYFITENFEIGMNPIGFQRYWVSNYSSTNIIMLIAPSYNFKMEGNLCPFIEVQLGYTAQTSSFMGRSSPTVNGLSWGGRVGIKFALTGHGLLNLGMQYQQLTYNPSGSTSRNGTNVFMLSAGFSFWL